MKEIMNPLLNVDFAADWRDMTFVHYRFAPEVLAPHAAFPLELYEGSAYVSLVLFSLERMRPWGSGPLGRALCRPISDHYFLNLRTYVRGPQGPGIQFLAEWIPNRLSLLLGPSLYGLPYRLGRFQDQRGGAAQTRQTVVSDAGAGGCLELETTAATTTPAACQPGTLAEFLLERYVAYTSHRGVRRYFTVRHAPWQVTEPAEVRCTTALVNSTFPWFAQGELVGAHETAGAFNVRMSRPLRLPLSNRTSSDGGADRPGTLAVPWGLPAYRDGPLHLGPKPLEGSATNQSDDVGLDVGGQLGLAQRTLHLPLAVDHRGARRARHSFFSVLD